MRNDRPDGVDVLPAGAGSPDVSAGSAQRPFWSAAIASRSTAARRAEAGWLRRLLILLGLTSAVRIVLLITVSSTGWPVAGPHDDDFWHSTDGYIALARSLVETGRFAFAPDAPLTVHRGPAFPAAIALAYGVTGSLADAVLLVNVAACGVLTTVMYLLALRLYGVRRGFWIALVASGYPLLEYYALTSWSDVFVSACFGLYVWATLRALESRRLADAGLSAVALALTLLAKSVFTPLPLAMLGLALVVRRRWVKLFVAQLVLSVLIVSPWAVRNSQITGRLTFVTTGAGFNLLVGNHMAEHRGSCADVFRSARADAVAELERRRGEPLGPEDLRRAGFYDVNLAVDHAMFMLAVEEFYRRPDLFVRKFGLNLARFWYFASSVERSRLVFAINVPLGLLAACELVRQRRRRRLTVAWIAFAVVCVWSAYALVIVHSRFYLAVIPLLAPFAVACAGHGVARLAGAAPTQRD